MITGRPPLLTTEEEEQLKEELKIAIEWEGCKTSGEIAEFLGFGMKGNDFAERLKRYHVYYYLNKFGLRIPQAKPKEVNQRSWE